MSTNVSNMYTITSMMYTAKLTNKEAGCIDDTINLEFGL